MKSRTSNTSRAIRDRMKKKLLLEQAAKQKQEKMNLELAKNLISTQAERNKMDNTERDNQLMKLLENRDKMPLRTQVRIDKFVEDFFRITKEDGIEFNDDGTTNHELSTYEENDDYKDFEDNRKVAAKATATAETKIMRSVAAEAKKTNRTKNNIIWNSTRNSNSNNGSCNSRRSSSCNSSTENRRRNRCLTKGNGLHPWLSLQGPLSG